MLPVHDPKNAATAGEGQRKPKNPSGKKSPPLLDAASQLSSIVIQPAAPALQPVTTSTTSSNQNALQNLFATMAAKSLSNDGNNGGNFQAASSAATNALAAKGGQMSTPNTLNNGVNQLALAEAMYSLLKKRHAGPGLNPFPNNGGLTIPVAGACQGQAINPASLLTNQDLSGTLSSSAATLASCLNVDSMRFPAPSQTPVQNPVLANLLQQFQQKNQNLQLGLDQLKNLRSLINGLKEQSSYQQGPTGAGNSLRELNVASGLKLDQALALAELLKRRNQQVQLPAQMESRTSQDICSSHGVAVGTSRGSDNHANKRSRGDNESASYDLKPRSKKPKHRLSFPSSLPQQRGLPQAERHAMKAPPQSQLQHEPPRKVKQENSPEDDSLKQPHKPCPPPPQQQGNPQGQANDPELVLSNHLINMLVKPNKDTTSLKNHFGLQALIREWIALSFSRRSFALLTKASDLAITFGMSMDRIISGVDDEITSGDKVGKKKNFIGGKMTYLLPVFLVPASSAKVYSDEDHHQRLTPHLPHFLLIYITPHSCSSFREINVGKRWTVIRESCRGGAKFYCSPEFEKNVLGWTRMSQIYEDNLTDVFSLIFANGQYDKLLEQLAKQVASHRIDDGTVSPIFSPTEIRLLEKSRVGIESGKNKIVTVKEIIDNVAADELPTIQVEMMLASVQTMDSHLVYMKFFDISSQAGIRGNQNVGRMSFHFLLVTMTL